MLYAASPKFQFPLISPKHCYACRSRFANGNRTSAAQQTYPTNCARADRLPHGSHERLPVAGSQAEKIFDDKFATFRSEWKRFASGDDVVGKLGPCHHAASAGLLLCAYFCPPELLDEKLALWNKAMADKEFEEMQGVWHLSPNRFIDPLFHLNLLVISGDRQGVPLEPLKEDLDRITHEMVEPPFCRIANLRLFNWDAETMDTDFTHVTRGVPSSGNSVLCELPGFSNPNASLYLQKPERAAQLEDVIQAWRRSK